MPLISWKVELKLRWAKHCVVVTANYNNNEESRQDCFYFYAVVTLSAKENQKLSKLLNKGLERSI